MQTTYKSIWLITYPVLLSLLVEQLIAMTDTAFLGRLGETELGASALASTYYLIFYVVGSGFGIGAQILMARLNGEKRYGEINSVFLTGGFFLVALAALITLFSQTLSLVILRQFIHSEEVYTATIDYLDWRIYGLFFSLVIVIFRSFLVATSRTKILTIASVIMVLTNMGCNYVLIFGKLGFPALGIAGAAIGSTVAELAACLFLYIYTKNDKTNRIYTLFQHFAFSWRQLKRILNTSVWTMLQSLLALSTWFAFFLLIEHLGKESLAISNIIRNLSSIPFLFTMAFAMTGSSLVSNLIGEGRPDEVYRLTKKVLGICYLFIVPIILIISVAPTLFLRIYTDQQALIEASVPTLYVMLFSHLIASAAFIMNFVVSGTGNTKAASMLELVALAIYVSYISYVTGYLKMEIVISWTAEYVYGASLLLLSAGYMWTGRWKNKKL